MRTAPLALLLLSPLAAPAAGPPAATLAQVEKALSRTDLAATGRPMLLKTRAIVAKPNGKEREEVVTESRLRADGTMETTIVSATKDGKDVTAEKRAEKAKREAAQAAKEAEAAKVMKAAPGAKASPAAGGEKGEKHEVSLGLKVPTGEDRKLFVFEDAAPEGALLVAAYEPVKGAKGDELSRGRIAWNAGTGEPAWIEARYADPPTGIKEFLLRGEFGGTGEAIYTRVLRTTGVGGVLWIKRSFDITMEMAPLPTSRE